MGLSPEGKSLEGKSPKGEAQREKPKGEKPKGGSPEGRSPEAGPPLGIQIDGCKLKISSQNRWVQKRVSQKSMGAIAPLYSGPVINCENFCVKLLRFFRYEM